MSPPLIPDGRLSRVRLAAAAFPGGPSQTTRGSSTRLHTPLDCMVIPPARHPLKVSLRPGSESRQCFLYGVRHLPRAPLPEAGVTRLRAMSRITSEGVTPPSSLLWAHAPHRVPLADLGLPLYNESLQVATSPCWKSVAPNIISAILA
jgi:hypothetical protein